MRERIYRNFSRENNIVLSSEVLEYLEKNVAGEDLLKSVSMEYRRRKGPKIADLRLLQDIVESFGARSQDIYNIIGQEFKRMDYPSKYKYLRERVGREITPIYMLGEEPGTLFGCYYRDRRGREVIEDDGDVIPLDMSNCKGDVFLCDNIFIAIQGRRVGQEFVAMKTHLPRIEKMACRKSRAPRDALKILFFSDFRMNEVNGGILRKILARIPADVVVIMGRLCSERSSGIAYSSFMAGLRPSNTQGQDPDIILCPDADDVYPSLLPKNISVPGNYSKGVKAATNPFILEAGGLSIGVIREDIFRYREKGTFIGENYVESFAKTVLSQYSFNPFGISNLDMDGIPDVFVAGQDLYPFVTSVDGVMFVSCPSFKSEMSFVSYDLTSNMAAILNSRDVLT